MKRKIFTIACMLFGAVLEASAQTADPTLIQPSSGGRPTTVALAYAPYAYNTGNGSSNIAALNSNTPPGAAGGFNIDGTMPGSGGRLTFASDGTTFATTLSVAGDMQNGNQANFNQTAIGGTGATGITNYFQYNSGASIKATTTITINNSTLGPVAANNGGVSYPDVFIGGATDAPAGRKYLFNVNNLILNHTAGDSKVFPGNTGATAVPNTNIFVNNTDIEVRGTATFTSGRIFLGDNDLFIVSPGNGTTTGSLTASTSGGSVNSYVDGNMRNLTQNASFTYQLGDQGIYSPTTIAGIGTSTTLRYYINANGHTSPTGVTPSSDQYLLSISPDEYYQVASDAPSGSTITIPLNGFSAYSNSNAASNMLTIAGWNGSKWVNLKGTGGVSATNGTPKTVSITTNMSLSGIQYYTLAVGSSFVLPITWLNFDAQAKGQTALLSWAIDGLDDANLFEVQRSKDGLDFTTIGTVKATNATAYTFTDVSPLDGIGYYRIKGVDKDGAVTYTRIAPLRFGSLVGSISLFPNPVQDVATLLLDKGQLGKVAISLYSASGTLLSSENIYVNQATTYKLEMGGYSAGFYMLKVATENGDITNIKVIKK